VREALTQKPRPGRLRLGLYARPGQSLHGWGWLGLARLILAWLGSRLTASGRAMHRALSPRFLPACSHVTSVTHWPHALRCSFVFNAKLVLVWSDIICKTCFMFILVWVLGVELFSLPCVGKPPMVVVTVQSSPLVALYYWRISGGRSDADARLARRVPCTAASDLVFS
jgi:hypothetical protein